MPENRPQNWIWLVPVLLLVAVLGVRSLNADMLWVDEVFSIGNVGGYQGPAYNPLQVWESLSQNSPQHVPGYFFVLGGWAALTGWTAFGLRALSLLFGLLAVAWTYRLGADWMSPRAGLYAALVVGIGAFYLYFTHEVRMYTMIAFLTVFVLWAYSRVIGPGVPRRPAASASTVPAQFSTYQPNMGYWLAFAVGALALLYTHLFGALVLAAIGLYHLLFVPKNRRWWVVVLILGVVGLSILPWLQVLLQGVRNVGLGEEPLPPLSILTEMLHLFSSGNGVGFALLAVFAAVGLVMRRRGSLEVWLFLIVIFMLTLIANEVRPMISEGRTRYLIHLWPLLALLIALGLTMLERTRYRVLALPLLAVWLGFGLGNTFNQQFLIDMDGPRYVKDYPPLREIVTATNQQAQPEDMLVTFSRQWHVFNIFRFFTVGTYHVQDLISDGHYITLPETRSAEEVRAALQGALGTRLTVWLAYEPITPADELAPYRTIIEEKYTLCETAAQQPGFVLERYTLTAVGCVDLTEPDTALVQYPAGIELRDIRAVAQGDQLLVAAAWTVDEAVPANTYSVSLKLWPADAAADSADGFVAQLDDGLRRAGYGWQLQTMPLADVPPGEYALTVTLYDWSTGERLTGSSIDGSQGDELPAATVMIEAE
ncbi:MAG: hypothetical protein CL610_01520 [Anaerolineaceae bacterium]|nr:hypothetical protein [Anaerolineaceae bacterium]